MLILFISVRFVDGSVDYVERILYMLLPRSGIPKSGKWTFDCLKIALKMMEHEKTHTSPSSLE